MLKAHARVFNYLDSTVIFKAHLVFSSVTQPARPYSAALLKHYSAELELSLDRFVDTSESEMTHPPHRTPQSVLAAAGRCAG